MIPLEMEQQCGDYKHVVLVQDVPLNSSYFEEIVYGENVKHHWELRYICSTFTGEQRHEWLTSLFCRHGGCCFPGWWKCERSGKSKSNSSGRFIPHDGEIPISTWDEWNIAVYVQVETVEFEKIRDQFLAALGGQRQVFCDEHDVPLVVTPFRDDNSKCCLRPCNFEIGEDSTCCTNRVSFQCPVDGCTRRICSEHHRCIRDTLQGDKKRYLFSTENEESHSNSFSTSSFSSATSSATSSLKDKECETLGEGSTLESE